MEALCLRCVSGVRGECNVPASDANSLLLVAMPGAPSSVLAPGICGLLVSWGHQTSLAVSLHSVLERSKGEAKVKRRSRSYGCAGRTCQCCMSWENLFESSQAKGWQALS